MTDSVLIISADPELGTSLVSQATRGGFDAVTAESLDAWTESGETEAVGCVVLHLAPGALTSPAQVAALAAACSSHRVLALTAPGDVPMAVQAIRQGAADVIQRSTRQGSILARIEKVLASTELTTRPRPPSVPDT